MARVSAIKLNNGLTIPALGLGTWQGVPGKETEVGQAVRDAIDLGYRLLDCAHVYGNEKAIGDAIQEKLRAGVVKREELFVTSKLWNNSHRPDLVEAALRTTLKNLQLDYVDLYLIHWPQAFQEGDDLLPRDTLTGKYVISTADYVETWKVMEQLCRKNLTKSIGISNFNSKQIKRLLENCKIIPAINQIECHPYLNQAKFRKFCDERGIKIMSYSPLGAPARLNQKSGDINVLSDDEIKKVAEKYRKTSAQILLRYNLQLGNVVIPKSANKQRLKENIDLFDFYLAPEDMAVINTLDCNGRVCKFEESDNHPDYPFPEDLEF